MRHHTLCILGTVSIFVWVAGCGGSKETAKETPAEKPAAAVTKVDPATAATVTGKVSFAGKPPARPRIDMSAEPDCKGLHSTPVQSEEVMVNSNGTLANVLVHVKAGLEGKTFEMPSTPVTLDQKGCIYSPHVVAVRAGQTIQISNSDPTTHNIHPLPKVNREWNQSQPPKGAPLEKSFPRPEVIPVKCNVHPWMKSYISVLDNPFYAITGDQGTFELKGLPPGEYVIEAWHERYPAQEQKVTLAPSASQTVEFTFKGE